MIFELNDGSFIVDFFIKLNEPVDLLNLFPEGEQTEANGTKFTYGGTLESRFPIELSLGSDDVVLSTSSPTPLVSTSFPTTAQPSAFTQPPTISVQPSFLPTNLPTVQPSLSLVPSLIPSSQPSSNPPRFGIILTITDDNLFASPIPTVDYEYDICPIVDSIRGSIQGLVDDLLGTVKEELNDLAPDSLTIDLDKVTGKQPAKLCQFLPFCQN